MARTAAARRLRLHGPRRRALRLAVALTATLLVGLVPAATETFAAAPGLVAAYAFDEGSGTTVADASGSGNGGTTANTAWATGKNGGALSFNGSTSRVTVPDSPSLRLTSAMTLEAWVRRSGSNSGWRDVVYKGDDNYYLSASSSPGNRPAGGSSFGGSYGEVFGTGSLSNNTWTHLAVTYDGTTLRLYVNGTQVSSLAKTGSFPTSSNPLTIGSDPIYGQYFQGLVDDVRVYDVALTAAQIQSDMATPVTSGGGGDTQAPSAPASLSAAAVSSGRVDLSWAASSDDVGVTGYRVERCAGAGCSSFAQIAAPSGTGTSFSDTGVVASTSYSYRVRAVDAAGNLGGYSPVASATTPADVGPAPVAAYSFNEGVGTAVTDATGNGHGGTAANATWTTGKNGGALSFDGTSSIVTVPDAASLRLRTAMTLEAWVQPSVANSGWRDLVYKGDDNYYLSESSFPNNRPAGGSSFGGSYGEVYGTAALPTGVWTHLAATYDGTTLRLYVNGTQVSSLAKSGTLPASSNPLTIGGDPIYGQYFQGLIDDVRVYDVALTAAQVQTDMATPVTASGDTQPPIVSISSPVDGSSVADAVSIAADASDNVGVAGVQFFVDGAAVPLAPEDQSAPYAVPWDSHLVSNGTHTLTAEARDLSGNVTLSTPVAVTVANTGVFQDEILATNFTLPTSFAFLPDGKALVTEMPGTVRLLAPPYTQADSTPFLTITNIAPTSTTGDIEGLLNIAVDPNFAVNHYYYVFYTAGSPFRSRLSRFTANADETGTVAGSETILYQDTADAGIDHHAGAIAFGNDGKLYFTTGDEFSSQDVSQQLTSPRGKVHRINMDGTIPTDNPFYDGNGPNVDSIWALGLRNPFHMYYDAPTGRLLIGDVGGNNYATAVEEIDLGAPGANYAWPNCESNCPSPPYTNPIFSYGHNGGEAAIVSGFVYHGSQFPASYEGSYFIADYAQNWIRRITFDASGNVNGLFPVQPPDGSINGPYGNVVDLAEGPEGALYYLDIGFDDNTDNVVTPKFRRIRYVTSNQPPVAASSADRTSGPPPLTVNFSSAGSSDPEGQPLSYSWAFGDGTTSTAANPSHTYTQAGRYTVRLTVSDGTNSTIGAPLTITVGNPPTPSILSPQDGTTFRGGDVISYSGSATDPEDGTLPASAFTWEIDFLHENHVHPGLPVSGSKTGTFTIPVTGHDFSGNTRYRITLTVTDSDGISTSTSVIIWPEKVNLSFDTVPSGLTLYLDGIAYTTPFVHDTLIGFQHTVEARDQSSGTTSYAFSSWSDGGARQHTIVVPSTDAAYTATYTGASAPATPAFVQVASSTPQTPQTTVTTSFGQPQTAGNLNVVAIGWDNTTSSVASVTDSAGNVYQVAAPTARSATNSQAIYYAKNVAAGSNTVTVTMSGATPYIDVRIAEYSGLDQASPLDVTSSGSGSNNQGDSGAVTTTAPVELLVGAGTTRGAFTGAGSGYTSRIITQPDQDILEDQVVTSTGSSRATAPGTTADWVMQLVTFRAAGQ